VIRDITPDDIPWVMSLGGRRYPAGYDPGGALQALVAAMRIKSAIAWRTDHAFLVANIVNTLWYPQRPQCEVLAICVEEAHHWDAVCLLRASAKWAREQGCARWIVASDTKHSIEAMAKRIGAEPMPRWGINLREPAK